jgi:hypothetical protein
MDEPTPLLDRIEAFMHDNPITREQGEVVTEFRSEPANVVRLALGALRKQGKLSHTVEGGKVYYIWSGEIPKRAADAPPLRQPGSAIAAKYAASPSADKVYAVLRAKPEDIFSCGEVGQIAGVPRELARQVLNSLVSGGKAYSEGNTSSKRYSLKPFLKTMQPLGTRRGPTYIPKLEPRAATPAPEPEKQTEDSTMPRNRHRRHGEQADGLDSVVHRAARLRRARPRRAAPGRVAARRDPSARSRGPGIERDRGAHRRSPHRDRERRARNHPRQADHQRSHQSRPIVRQRRSHRGGREVIARMTKEGVITLEPQNGTEVVALQAWQAKNRISLDDGGDDTEPVKPFWRGAALEILVRD